MSGWAEVPLRGPTRYASPLLTVSVMAGYRRCRLNVAAVRQAGIGEDDRVSFMADEDGRYALAFGPERARTLCKDGAGRGFACDAEIDVGVYSLQQEEDLWVLSPK